MLREDNLLKQISIVQNMIVANVVTLIKVLLEVKWKSVCDYQQTVYHWSEVEKNLCFEWVYGAKHKNIFKSFASLKCFSSYATCLRNNMAKITVQSKWGKIRTRKTSNTGTFYLVMSITCQEFVSGKKMVM